MGWLSENGLALYGAITGTAALAISYISHRHSIKRDSIKLSVTLTPHPSQKENIQNMLSTEGKEAWEHVTLTEIFLVTVRNLGSIPAPLDDVGVITINGTKEHALVSKVHRHGGALYRVAESDIEALEPKDSRVFSVYLKREQAMFTAASGYAIDKTGKSWISK